MVISYFHLKIIIFAYNQFQLFNPNMLDYLEIDFIQENAISWSFQPCTKNN